MRRQRPRFSFRNWSASVAKCRRRLSSPWKLQKQLFLRFPASLPLCCYYQTAFTAKLESQDCFCSRRGIQRWHPCLPNIKSISYAVLKGSTLNTQSQTKLVKTRVFSPSHSTGTVQTCSNLQAQNLSCYNTVQAVRHTEIVLKPNKNSAVNNGAITSDQLIVYTWPYS